MSTLAHQAPRVTIVMGARERHALTEATLDGLVAGTARPFRLLYLDVESPDWLRRTLTERAGEWGLEVVRFDEPLWPQQARRRVLPRVDTEYVVFIDNDVQVEDGWLEALLACADETGAGIVGPLYLWGDGVAAPRVHMAGGRLTESAADGRRVLDEAHLLFDADPERVAGELVRRPCDYVEFHCMLVRSALLRDPALFDPEVLCVHEHIDAALAARERGYAVYLEPAARITYLAHAEFMLDDLPLFRRRWAAAAGEASIAAFCRRWNVLDDERSFGGVRRFLRDHVADVDPLRAQRADQAVPMRRDELCRTRSELLDLALARGYADDELALLADAWRVAQALMDGGYRPCGRPFLDHVTGTAGVLVRYGFRAELVAAGLLHAAYSHCPPHPAGPRAAAEAVAGWLGGKGGAVESRVRAYTLRERGALQALLTDDLSELFVFDAEIVALVAANEVDMLLSGEVRYSGRRDLPDAAAVQAIGHVCRVLGVEGLARTLVDALAADSPAPAALMTQVHASYRLAPDRLSLVPMVGDVPTILEPAGPPQG